MRQLGLPFYLAFQYIRRGRKWTLFLTIFLMTAAFVNLIFLPSLFNGIIDGANKQIINTLTGDVYITPNDGEDYISNINHTLDQLRTVDGVSAVSAKTSVPASLKYNNITLNRQILAINPSNEKGVSIISQKITSGSYLSSGDKDQIILGKQIAGGSGVEENAISFKGAKVGQKVTLILNGKPKQFTIKGIFDTNFVQSDERAFITDSAFKSIMPTANNKATTINIRINQNTNEDAVVKSISQKNIGGKVYRWQEAAGVMKSVSNSFLSINIILSFTSVLIAAVTIIIIIYVTIINKRKEIGILRAIGIKPYIIVFSYVILSAIYATAGIIIGTILFYAIIMPYFQIHPFVLPICNAVLVLGWSDYIIRLETIVWVSVFAGFIPSVIVTRTKMLNAILGK
jgi:putative ABC transport system permease protein